MLTAHIKAVHHNIKYNQSTSDSNYSRKHQIMVIWRGDIYVIRKAFNLWLTKVHKTYVCIEEGQSSSSQEGTQQADHMGLNAKMEAIATKRKRWLLIFIFVCSFCIYFRNPQFIKKFNYKYGWNE